MAASQSACGSSSARRSASASLISRGMLDETALHRLDGRVQGQAFERLRQPDATQRRAAEDRLHGVRRSAAFLTAVGALQTAPILIAVLTAFLTMEGIKYLLTRHQHPPAAGGETDTHARPASRCLAGSVRRGGGRGRPGG